MGQFSFQPRYTVEDYLNWEGDWELWDGQAVSMSPSPIRDHQLTIRNLLILLQRQLWEQDGCECTAISDIDWRVSQETVFRPDVAVMCHETDIGDYIEATPRLVVEVLSDATMERDRHAKRLAYAQLGVRFYLMVDHWARQITALRLAGGEYQPTDLELELHDGCRVNLDDPMVWRGLRRVRRL